MRILTYHEPIADSQFDDHAKLVEAFRANWSRLGWEVEVLRERHARAHAAWAWYSGRVAGLPTVNKPAYEFACFVRWLAFARSMRPGEIAAVADYDVFNTDFGPAEAKAMSCPDRPINTDINFGSGPFLFTYDQMQAVPPMMVVVISLLRTYQNPGGIHWADMEVWKAQNYGNMDWPRTVPICLEFGPEVRARLVHITYSSCARFGFTKLSAWQHLEKSLCP